MDRQLRYEELNVGALSAFQIDQLLHYTRRTRIFTAIVPD